MATHGKLNHQYWLCDACGVEGEEHEGRCGTCKSELCAVCCRSCADCGNEFCPDCVRALPVPAAHVHMNEYVCASCNAKRLAVAA
jgi:hypothetical protein